MKPGTLNTGEAWSLVAIGFLFGIITTVAAFTELAGCAKWTMRF